MILRSKLINTYAFVLCAIIPSSIYAETFDLIYERMTDPNPSWRSANSVFFGVSAQYFGSGTNQERIDKFNAAVKNEPKYTCNQPIKGVAELGDSKFGFVIDSEDLKTKGYHRLYFDFNGDGDLADEKPVDGGPAQNEGSWSIDRTFFPLQVTLKVGGKSIDYPFVLSSSSHYDEAFQYGSASIRPAAYRRGTISLDGETHQIAILDYNCNGKFNDPFKINDEVKMADRGVWPEYGDVVVIDGKQHKGEYYWDITTGGSRQYLSKLARIGERYYEIQVTPDGEKVTLTPYKGKLGQIANSNDYWRAVIYGKQGLLKVSGRKDQPVAVPEGEWRLLSCCLDSGQAEPTSRSIEGARSAQTRDDVEPTRLTARGKSDYKPVQVTSGKVAQFPFGPPYKPVVEVGEPRYSDNKSARELRLSLVGVGGEVVSDCQLNGNRPGEPTFVIATADGDIIERGKFEYG